MTEETIQLSDRESEILRLVATGATNQQIATNLDISINTVKVHMRNIFGKIGASSRTEATLYAMRFGLVEAVTPPLLERLPAIVPEAAPPLVEAVPVVEQAVEQAVVPPPVEIASALVISMPEAPSVSPRTRGLAGWLLPAAALLLVLLGAGYLLYARQMPFFTTAPTPLPAAAPQAERWQSRLPLIQQRADFGLASYDGRIYAIAGRTASGLIGTVERFDPQNNIWVQLSTKPTAVSRVQAVTVGGLIYVPGGELNDGVVSTVVEAYDPRGERWETLAPLPEPRSRYALAGVEGRLYLFGGWDGSEYRAEVFIYDPVADSWTQGSPMPSPRRDAAAAVIENRVYVVGGESSNGPLRVNERYDPAADPDGEAWIGVAPPPEGIVAPAVISIANVLIAFDPANQRAAIFQPSTESWNPLALPESVGVSSRAAALTTTVFVFGPAPDDGALLGPLYEYQAVYTNFLPASFNP